jgi:2-polyprenyl-6-methoxyphenol hydroxylase-like FAD-dependent oxidoreductase
MAASDQLFVVRMWYERSVLKAGEWRGSVTHVPSGSRWYFSDLAQLNDFVRTRLAAAGDAAATAPS